MVFYRSMIKHHKVLNMEVSSSPSLPSSCLYHLMNDLWDYNLGIWGRKKHRCSDHTPVLALWVFHELLTATLSPSVCQVAWPPVWECVLVACREAEEAAVCCTLPHLWKSYFPSMPEHSLEGCSAAVTPDYLPPKAQQAPLLTHVHIAKVWGSFQRQLFSMQRFSHLSYVVFLASHFNTSPPWSSEEEGGAWGFKSIVCYLGPEVTCVTFNAAYDQRRSHTPA